MSLWVDKYRPMRLEKLDYHKALSQQLQNMAAGGDFPHLLVYGPSGAGKKTRINAILREIFGNNVDKIGIVQRVFTTQSGKRLEIPVISSNYHMEMNPSDVGSQDRLVVQELIKELAQTQQIDANAARKFKVVVITEADALSRDAQSALRRTMEKYMQNLRIILVANNTSKLMSPIRSRCLLVRVAAPSAPEIVHILQKVAKSENFMLPEPLADAIAAASERNLRKAILMLEATKVQHPSLSADTQLQLSDWEIFIIQIARGIMEQQSPERLLAVRLKFYELLTHCIPADLILKKLSFALIGLVDGQMKAEVAYYAALFEHRIRIGSKAIYHLEAFVAKFMAIYKQFLIDFYG